MRRIFCFKGKKIDEVHNEVESFDSDLIRNNVQPKKENLCSYKTDTEEMLIFLKTRKFSHCSRPDFYLNDFIPQCMLLLGHESLSSPVCRFACLPLVFSICNVLNNRQISKYN